MRTEKINAIENDLEEMMETNYSVNDVDFYVKEVITPLKLNEEEREKLADVIYDLDEQNKDDLFEDYKNQNNQIIQKLIHSVV